MFAPADYNNFSPSSFYHIQPKRIEITKGCFLFKFKGFLFKLI